MSNELVEYIDQLVSEASWPAGAAVGGEGQQTYETGVDLLHSYRGDPAYLRDALRLFQRCGSAPYAQAGISYVLVLASYESGDDYDADGLRLAGEKLDMARSVAPGRVEIEFLGALIPVLSGRLSEARPILDHLETAYPAHYFVSVTEMYYWYEAGDVEQFRRWYRKASEQADTESRRKDLLNRLAGLYMKLESWEDCIEAYRQLAEIDAADPWLWHNMSIAYIRTDRIEDARECNDRALALMDFDAARRIQRYIQEQRPGWRRWFRR